MPFVLTIIAVGDTRTEAFVSGSVTADLDWPAAAELQVEGALFTGTRSLIVAAEEDGYVSGWRLIHVPESHQDAARLDVPREWAKDFKAVVTELMNRSPSRSLAAYVEANRIISRQEPDPNPVRPALHARSHWTCFIPSSKVAVWPKRLSTGFRHR